MMMSGSVCLILHEALFKTSGQAGMWPVCPPCPSAPLLSWLSAMRQNPCVAERGAVVVTLLRSLLICLPACFSFSRAGAWALGLDLGRQAVTSADPFPPYSGTEAIRVRTRGQQCSRGSPLISRAYGSSSSMEHRYGSKSQQLAFDCGRGLKVEGVPFF